jgi:hypothetical protein
MASVTEDEADKRKAALASRDAGYKMWHHDIKRDPYAAINWLNTWPTQVAGEAFVANRPDGEVDVYWFG